MIENENIKKNQFDRKIENPSPERRKTVEFDTHRGISKQQEVRKARTQQALKSIEEKMPWLFENIDLDNMYDVQRLMKIGLQEKLTIRWLDVQSQLSEATNKQFIEDNIRVNNALIESWQYLEKNDNIRANQAINEAKNYLLKIREYLPKESNNVN